MPQCTAKSKRSGERCKKDAMHGGNVCHIHGGKSPKGAASPTFKHGKRSKYLPQRVANIYDEMQSDDEYMDLRDNLRLREALIREKLKMIDDAPDSMEVWKSFRKALDQFKKAWANEDYGNAAIAISDLDTIIDERLVYLMVQSEIRADLAEQRKDQQAIAQIEYKGENAIPAQQLMALMGAVLNVIQTVVTDKNQRIAIADGIDTIFSTNSAQSTIDA